MNQTSFSVSCVRVLALGLMFFLCAGHAASADNEAVLVLDYSSAMWSKIAGSPKITTLRGAIAPALKEQAGKLNLGVVAFGTAKGKACDAVETLKSTGTITPDADSKALEAANPKGSSPIASAITAAGKLLKSQTGAQSVILVAGSVDSCEADPCAAASDLKEKSPRSIVHVIGFDAEADDKLQELSCVAEQTGGVFMTAGNADELQNALQRILRLAAAGNSEDADGKPVPAFLPPIGGVGSPGGQPATSKEPGTLTLAAILAKDTQPLTSGLTWRIYDGRVYDDGSYRLLFTFHEARPTVTLTPGDYLVNSAYGRANITKRLTVWPEKRQEDVFNLNAGGLRLYATLAKQPLLSDQSLTFDIYSEETDQYGNRRKVIGGAKPGIIMRLNSGTYRVESSYGDSNAVMEADITVEAGKLTEATIDHQAGKVTFRLVQKPGGEALADTIWNIYGSDGQLVKKSGGAFPSHVLAAGNYEVKVQHKNGEFAKKFTVEAGDKKQVEVVMP
ncbi:MULTISPECIES: hypothetical protein [Rhodomicrobium]|uniref:vWA domain-containing protein n=1 Tax=Rhodomicrobium TaxID=1068 RepID=UPI000B4B206F|nr:MULTISPECIES: hypothetical protein [Rhodomicrobium]